MLLLIAFIFSFLTTTPYEVAAQGHLGFRTGSQTLEITCYSMVKNGIFTGNYIQSDLFTVGGYNWTIQFYPQGYDSSYSDYVSVMVTLVNSTSAARAMFNHQLRDWNTLTWSTNTPSYSGVNIFQPKAANNSWGFFQYIKRSTLEASSYLRSDTVVIKTTLWVAQGNSTVLQLPLSNHANSSMGDDSNSIPANVATDDVVLESTPLSRAVGPSTWMGPTDMTLEVSEERTRGS